MAIRHTKNILTARLEDGELKLKVVGIGTYGKTDKGVSVELIPNVDGDTVDTITELLQSILDNLAEEVQERVIEQAGEAQAIARRLGEE